MKINKKAQIGSTLTWVAALVVIIFIMVLFTFASLGLAKVKGVTNIKNLFSGDSSLGNPTSNNLELTEDLINFLNIPYPSENIIVSDIFSRADIDKENEASKEFYIQTADAFLNKNFPVGIGDKYSSASLSLEYINSNQEFTSLDGYFQKILEPSEGNSGELSTSTQNEATIYIFPNKRVKLEVIEK